MRPVILGVMLMATAVQAVEVTDLFLGRIAWVESRCNPSAINFSSNAYGMYQIRALYLQDANMLLGTAYTLNDMLDPVKAEKVVRAYLGHWGAKFAKRNGRQPTEEELARIHNGGPRGAERDCTLAYAGLYREAPI